MRREKLDAGWPPRFGGVGDLDCRLQAPARSQRLARIDASSKAFRQIFFERHALSRLCAVVKVADNLIQKDSRLLNTRTNNLVQSLVGFRPLMQIIDHLFELHRFVVKRSCAQLQRVMPMGSGRMTGQHYDVRNAGLG